MGGGGGTGVKSLTNTATNGGNGGGMVFIITGVLTVMNGASILANGQTVTTAVNGSGGGGGAGGTVLLDVTGYSGSFDIQIHGGYGGRVNGTPCTGTGGGGSGGVLWYSGTSLPGINVDTLFGSAGFTGTCLTTIGSPGGSGGKLKNLITPLTGFLFNSIRGTDTLCAGQVLPHPLKGSQPKGGDGNYDFQWEQSTDKVNWSNALGTATLRTFQPPALDLTTYYRRIVNSTSPETYEVISDTSRTLEVHVFPAISNNTVSGRDTICFDLQAKTLTGTSPAGGNGSYNYQWQYSTDQSAWNAGGTGNSYDPGRLQQSLYFRRIATSTIHCTHTSNSVKITVLLSISGNTFVTPDTVICENLGPGFLNAKNPANGDGTYSYEWQFRTSAGIWTSIAASNLNRYNPGALADSTLYRRIVYSGNDRACKDTSLIKTINVLPAITNNLAATATTRYCAGDTPVMISGTQPSGGDGIYSYQWRISSSGDWSVLPGATSMNYAPDQIVETNTRFSRIVVSGNYNACRDTSAELVLDVIPYITNTLDLADQTICENNTPAQLNSSPAAGGLGGFTYQWIQQEKDIPGWENAPGDSSQISYAPGALIVTTLFARKVFSDICSRVSDTVTVTVYPAISNNSITVDALQYTCFNTTKSLPGSLPVNGNGSYLYVWEQSSNNADWIPADMIPEYEQNFITPALTATQYFRRIVISSPDKQECFDTSNVVEVRINPLPTGDVIGRVDTLCAGETLVVRFSAAGIHPPFAVTIGGQIKNGITMSPDSMSFILADSQTLTMISVEDDSSCVADPTAFTGQARAVVYDVPVADAGSDDDICDNTYTLRATKSITGSSGNWTANGATFSDPSDPQSQVTADQYGTNTLTWTETNWHCTDDDQVNIHFYEQPQNPDAGTDLTLNFTYTTQLQANTPSVGSGKWTIVTGSGSFSNDTLPDATVIELDNSNTLQWTIHNGNCPEVSDRVNILVSPLVIPKGFTPNGDTKNDVFDLGAVNAEKIRIKIYNSAGIPVFESDDYGEGNLWDGRNMNGVEVPEGTYFYVADIKIAGRAKEFQFRSFVEILR
jgi:gliding motility-associated-like protein